MAVSFSRKTWIDNETTGTPITDDDMNRLEKGISDTVALTNSLESKMTGRVQVSNTEPTDSSVTLWVQTA